MPLPMRRTLPRHMTIGVENEHHIPAEPGFYKDENSYGDQLRT